jgi:hypothetical protein
VAEKPSLELGQTLPRAAELKFALYRRPLHPELFSIRQSRHLERAAYQADVWVIGLAHVLTVQSAGRSVTEVVTDDVEMLPHNGLVTSFQFRGERDHMEEFDDGMKYILSTQVERMTQNLFHASHRDLLNYGRSRGLLVQFREWTDTDDLAPFTFIDFELRDRELHLQAFHAFPADYSIVKTQSIVEVGAQANAPRLLIRGRSRG